MLSLWKISMKVINSSASMALNCYFFRGSHICTPYTTIYSQLIFQSMCEFSRPKQHKPKCPHLCHSLNCALKYNPECLSRNWSPQSTPSMFLLYLVKSSGQKTWCISWPLLLGTSFIPVFLKILMNFNVLDSFHIVDARRNHLLYILL